MVACYVNSFVDIISLNHYGIKELLQKYLKSPTQYTDGSTKIDCCGFI